MSSQGTVLQETSSHEQIGDLKSLFDEDIKYELQKFQDYKQASQKRNAIQKRKFTYGEAKDKSVENNLSPLEMIAFSDIFFRCSKGEQDTALQMMEIDPNSTEQIQLKYVNENGLREALQYFKSCTASGKEYFLVDYSTFFKN